MQGVSRHRTRPGAKVLSPSAQLLAAIRTAREEWELAKNYFESVTEPELIDHAIFSVSAAEKRYMYLLKLAREEVGQAGRMSGPPDAYG